MIGITVNSRAIKAIQAAMQEATHTAIRQCAEEYKFDASEAISKFGMVEVSDGKSKKAKKQAKKQVLKPSVTLPFCGCALDGVCHGIKLNRGLYTQCMNLPAGEGGFCTTCARQAAQNDGKPTYGTIEERIAEGDSWRDPKGKAPTNYGNVMLKLNISKDEAIEEANKFGWTIPEEQFEVVKAKKGRPAKAKKEKDPDAAPKKRGRPKKTKKVVTGGTGDDLIANLVAQAQVSVDDDEKSSPTATDETSTEDEAESSPAPAKKATRKPKKSAEEKEAEKLAKAEAKAKAKAEKEAAKEAEKLAKAEAKAKAKAEKEAAKEAEKLAKAEAKAKAKAEKAALKEAESKDDEESTEASIDELKEQLDELQIEEHVESGEEDEDDDDAVEVEKFEYEGKEFLRDANGTVYDIESQEEIGTWDGEKMNLMAGVDSDED